MKIIELRLERYSRLRLNHIESLQYNPVAKIQVIVGTNGSGKSSLLHEMSPLPANHKNYLASGKKVIRLEHNGSLYELTNHFDTHQTHSFIKDGKELNDGTGKYSTQLDLVQKYFGVTPKIHELALGVRRFHAMSVGERREWFTLLSDANYDYAISVYNRVKERARDISGAIKVTKKRLSLESNKIYSETELSALRTKCQQLYDLVALLQENRQPTDVSVETLENQRYDIREEITRKSKTLERLIQNVIPHREELAGLEQELDALNTETIRCRSLSDKYFKDHEQLEEKFKIAKKIKEQSLHELKQVIARLQNQIDAIRGAYKLQLEEVADTHGALGQLNSVYNWMEPISATLAEHKGKGYTTQTFETMELTIQVLKANIQNAINNIQRHQGVITHMDSLRNQGLVTCPNCSHQWINGFDQGLYDNSRAIVESASQQRLTDEKRLEELQQEIKLVQSYLQARERFSQIVRNSDQLSNFWDYVLKEEVIENNPVNLWFLLDQYRLDLEDQQKVVDLLAQIKNKNQLIKEADQNEGLDYDFLAQAKKDLESEILILQEHQRDVTKRSKRTQELTADSRAMQSASDELNRLLALYDDHQNLMVETHRRQSYNEMLRMVQSYLSKHEAQLHEAENHQATIKEIESQIETLEGQEKCLKAMAKELSPSEGLIAEGLFGFMRLFIQKMNSFIKRIWTYPLIVQPCALGADGSLDLDYKFPVVVDTADNVRNDVSEGSSAMHEVIDLAFRITAMKALHLNDYPLFLDEFGSTMDPTHKAATIQLINSIMEQDNFPQLFMISHDTVQYGALSNTEVVVLSSDNMLLSKDAVYNQNIVFNS